MKYYLIAGEASGDLHGSNLMRELKGMDASASFRYWGGDKMTAQGGELVKHIKEMSFMGFWEVFINLRTILGFLKLCERDLLAYKPDVLILIDYPGFNLRMAEFAKKNDIKVVYYISPQIWAWKASRVKKIKAFVDRMLVILPFEKEFYQKYGVTVHFPGHPLLDAIANFKNELTERHFRETHGLTDKPIVALLPGSRMQEIISNLPTMAATSKYFGDYQFVVAGVHEHPQSCYNNLVTGTDVKIILGQTYPLLSVASAAIVASGTATLETALFGVPQVVCYRINRISYLIARKLIKVKYISLVNLILNRRLVDELIQNDFNDSHLRNALGLLLHDLQHKKHIAEGYEELIRMLGGKGASKNAAKMITDFLAR